jgi:hypothetical protein
VKQINPNIFPKDGFWFREADGARINGETWANVVARVIAYRRRTHVPEGNAKQDIINQACERNPNLCVEDNGVTQATRRKASLKTIVFKWLLDLLTKKNKDGVDFVDEGTHNQRADICAHCPKNLQIVSGCGACESTLKAQREAILGSRKADGRLFGCADLGEYLPVSTWVESQALDKPELPAACWRKRTL